MKPVKENFYTPNPPHEKKNNDNNTNIHFFNVVILKKTKTYFQYNCKLIHKIRIRIGIFTIIINITYYYNFIISP